MTEQETDMMDERDREKAYDQPLHTDEIDEMESMATIGLCNDDPYAGAEYEKRLHFLEGWIRRRRIVKLAFAAGKQEGRRECEEAELQFLEGILCLPFFQLQTEVKGRAQALKIKLGK